MALGQAVVTHRWVGARHRICSVAQHCVLWPCIRSGLQKRNPTPSRRTLGGRIVSSTGETLFHFTITLKEVVVRWEPGFSTKHHVIKLCYHPSLILLTRDLPLSSPSSLAVYLPLQAIWEPSCNFPSSSPSLWLLEDSLHPISQRTQPLGLGNPAAVPAGIVWNLWLMPPRNIQP